MNAAVLSLEEGLARLSAGSLPAASVALTFDDGFVDFLEHGVPALAEFGFPCTLYLTTYYMKHRLPVVNLALDYILWKSKQVFVRLHQFGIDDEMSLTCYAERQKIVRKVLKWADEKKLDTPGRDELARSVAEQLNVDYQQILDRRMVQILSPEEVTSVARKDIDVQLHTHRHRTPMDRDLFQREIRDNRRDIYETTGKKPVHFCYPSGVYAPEFLPWLKECDVQSATTCERGLAARNTEPLLLPRVLDDGPTGLLQFQSFVSGLFAVS
jgi:peptidoglycan/xylan/chitin deacetylase (PgdA/CDA1 family)